MYGPEWTELIVRGIAALKIMKLHGINACTKRKLKAITGSRHNLPVAPNLLNRQFIVALTNRVWASDITCLGTDEGWLYLAVVIDLSSVKL